MYKNGPPSSLMRASCTDYYELITDNFITSGISTYCVIIVQPLFLPSKIPYKKDRGCTKIEIIILKTLGTKVISY